MYGENKARRGQLRGYIFEVVIRRFLKANGWILLDKPEQGRLRVGNDYKIEIKGRGTWHQIDSPSILTRRLPFTYPLRLLAEVKFHSKAIQKDKIRAYIGLIKDISENYFIDDNRTIDSQIRYTDFGAIFSATGFEKEAANLAFVHGIKTISYRTNQEMRTIKETIEKLERDNLSIANTIRQDRQYRFMKDLENVLISYDSNVDNFIQVYNSIGNIRENLKTLSSLVSEKKSSFFGMTSTGVLLHFLSSTKFPVSLFKETDEQPCRVFYEKSVKGISMWMQFSNDTEHRRYYFDVPPGLEEVIEKGQGILDEKGRHFETISVLFFIDNITRMLALKIDKEWLAKLKNRSVG